MGVRPFAGIQTLSGSSQPVFGTTASASFTPPPDPFLNNNGPGSNQTQVKIAVASSIGFMAGDQVAIGAASAFEPPSVTIAQTADIGTIKSIPDSTHLIVQGLTKSHASGEYVVLDEIVFNVKINAFDGTANDPIYIGNAPTVAAGDASVFDIIYAPGGTVTEPLYYLNDQSVGGSQSLTTTSYWIIGTSGDKFVARFIQV